MKKSMAMIFLSVFTVSCHERTPQKISVQVKRESASNKMKAKDEACNLMVTYFGCKDSEAPKDLKGSKIEFSFREKWLCEKIEKATENKMIDNIRPMHSIVFEIENTEAQKSYQIYSTGSVKFKGTFYQLDGYQKIKTELYNYLLLENDI